MYVDDVSNGSTRDVAAVPPGNGPSPQAGSIIGLHRTDKLGRAPPAQPTPDAAPRRRAPRHLRRVEGGDLRRAVLRHTAPGRREGSPVPDRLGRRLVPADRPERVPEVSGPR